MVTPGVTLSTLGILCRVSESALCRQENSCSCKHVFACAFTACRGTRASSSGRWTASEPLNRPVPTVPVPMHAPKAPVNTASQATPQGHLKGFQMYGSSHHWYGTEHAHLPIASSSLSIILAIPQSIQEHTCMGPHHPFKSSCSQ